MGVQDVVLAVDGSRELSRDQVGGKALGLNRMMALGLPVPPAFVVPVAVCQAFHAGGPALPEPVWRDVLAHLARLEGATGRAYGGPAAPLLLAVRSGAAVSMPGMMDTVLNLGLTANLRDVLAAESGDPLWAEDTFRRFHRDYTATVGAPVPDDPRAQLRGAVGAVFGSWFSARAMAYRDRHGLSAMAGTSVTVQAMVFGNRDGRSGTGVLFSRDPVTGAPGVFGEWLPGAQGHDVVAGERTPYGLDTLAEAQAGNHRRLVEIAALLEADRRDMVDVEFTIESGRLHILQVRVGKRSAEAALRIARDMVAEGMISESVARDRLSGVDIAMAVPEQVSPGGRGAELARGIPAGPGRGSGVAVTGIDEALRLAEEGASVVLVRPTTSPDDVPAMFVAAAVVTEHGGSTSHAAVVCRELGLPCVVGCGEGVGARLAGRRVTVDGTEGRVLRAEVSTP
ncbi:pyruvate, orthophosphate dikinase [Sinosporangium album]|uniref:Pyruvate, orthophosphate dikinase n=1 Tax=Sinosporangium album TaxID=504805 RepID=A0A1G8B7Z4_9ACTN|nr:pyruvate, phosphate dikinase [Sinosporangium album]SDH29123.1 pyruvate, orthophosphate dikinase [Sinosporangium album]